MELISKYMPVGKFNETKHKNKLVYYSKSRFLNEVNYEVILNSDNSTLINSAFYFKKRTVCVNIQNVNCWQHFLENSYIIAFYDKENYVTNLRFNGGDYFVDNFKRNLCGHVKAYKRDVAQHLFCKHT